ERGRQSSFREGGRTDSQAVSAARIDRACQEPPATEECNARANRRPIGAFQRFEQPFFAAPGPGCAAASRTSTARHNGICVATGACGGIRPATAFAAATRSAAIGFRPGSPCAYGGGRSEASRRNRSLGFAREEASNGTADRAAIQPGSGNANSYTHGGGLAARRPASRFLSSIDPHPSG